MALTLDPLSFVDAFIGPEILTFALAKVVGPLTFVAVPRFGPGHHALPVALIPEELTRVNDAIFVRHLAFARAHVEVPHAAVFRSVAVSHGAFSIALTAFPSADVLRAVSPKIRSLAVELVAFPFALVARQIGPDHATSALPYIAAPLPFVATAVRSCHLASTASLVIVELTFVSISIRPSLNTVALALASLLIKLAFVRPAAVGPFHSQNELLLDARIINHPGFGKGLGYVLNLLLLGNYGRILEQNLFTLDLRYRGRDLILATDYISVLHKVLLEVDPF